MIIIEPGNKFLDLPFGATELEIIKHFGKPKIQELIENSPFTYIQMWYYLNLDFVLLLQKQEKYLFYSAEISNSKTYIWQTPVFDLNEKEIIQLFKTNGYKEFETESEPWGEKRLSFDDAGIDFHFEKNKLLSVSFCKPFN
jgi:hypothetical protein